MKKRMISILLVLLLMFSFAGCKKEIPVDETKETTANETTDQKQNTQSEEGKLVPEEGAKLIFWTGDVEFGKAVGKKFEEKYGVPVTVEELGLGAIDKIALSGPAGTGADVFMSPHDSFQHGVASGLFLELDDSIVKDIEERVNEVGVKTVTADGKVYGVPISLETSCLFYNKDIVGNQPATTLEEIIEKAKDFNDPTNNKFYLLTDIGNGYTSYPMLSSYGFSLFGKDGNDNDNPGFDTEEFEKGLDLVSSLHEVIPISSADLSNGSFLKSQFTEGKVAYEISGPWDVTEFKKSGVNFGVSVLPTYNGKEMTPFAGVQNAHVSAFTDYPIAAQLFAEYLVSDEAASLLYELANKIPTLKDISNINSLAEDEYIKPFIEQFNNSYPMPSTQRMSYYWTIGADVLKAVFDGQLTPAEGRQKAVSDWNTMLTTE